MPYQPQIKRYLLEQGLDLIEVAGWETRGSENFDPRGSVNHHTAGPGPRYGNHPTLNVLINGRSDLPGPISNASLSRDDKVYLIAAGRANHAGAGGWRGLSGNSSVWGLEVEHTGVLATEPPPNQSKWDLMAKVHAAFALCSGFSKYDVCQHFQWTTRKIDFINAEPNVFETRVGYFMKNPGGGNVVNSLIQPGDRGPDVWRIQEHLMFWWSQGLGGGLRLHPGVINGVYHPQTAEAARQLKIIMTGGVATQTINPTTQNWDSNIWIEYGKFLQRLASL